MGLFALILAPYIDRNPSNKPEDRKFAISLFTIFLMFWAVLVIIGSFFRGPGFNFVFPWNATASSSSCEDRSMSSHGFIVAIAIAVWSWCWPACLCSCPARRTDSRRPAGALSRETVRATAPTGPGVGRPPTGRRSSCAAGGSSAPPPWCRSPPAPPPAPYVPPDPEHHRRHPPPVLQPLGIVTLMTVAIAGFGAAVHGLPVAQAVGRLRLQDQHRQHRRRRRPASAANNGFLYVPEGRMWVTEFPPRGAEGRGPSTPRR
jgi:hypothetical protein